MILCAAVLGAAATLHVASPQTAVGSAPAGPVQPWALAPLPPGAGPVEKFADVSGTPQGKFLKGGAFDTQGNLWFVAIGSGWISYLTLGGKLVPVVNCNPPADYGETCEPRGSRWHDGKLYLTTRHRGILVYDPQKKELKTLVYIYRNQLFKGPNDLDFDARATCSSPIPGAQGPGPTCRTAPARCISIPRTACCAGCSTAGYSRTASRCRRTAASSRSATALPDACGTPRS
jgi:hypothetical protein